MTTKQEWLDMYESLKRYFRPYLGGKIRLDEVDVFTIWAYHDLRKLNRDKFIIVDKVNRYAFHIGSGYLCHVFGKRVFDFSKPKYGTKSIQYTLKDLGIRRVRPGRKIVYAERYVEGPRGGKLLALGSCTHITTNPKIVTNPITRKHLVHLQRIIGQKFNIAYPNIYLAEKKYWFYPFRKVFYYAIENLVNFKG